MFEVLVFVYEHYWRGDGSPEFTQLGRRLSAAGFDADEIEQALHWLQGLEVASADLDLSQTDAISAAPGSLRIWSPAEQERLGAAGLGFIGFLESAGVLPPPLREIVMDRAMATTAGDLTLEELKIIVLMVYWRFGQEPDALVLDELCADSSRRVAH